MLKPQSPQEIAHALPIFKELLFFGDPSSAVQEKLNRISSQSKSLNLEPGQVVSSPAAVFQPAMASPMTMAAAFGSSEVVFERLCGGAGFRFIGPLRRIFSVGVCDWDSFFEAQA